MNSVQSQHATGRISSEIPDIWPQNTIERLVLWLHSNETPLIYKIGAIGLAVISGYAIGALIGYPLLTAALVTLIFSVVDYTVLDDLRLREQVAQARAEHDTQIEVVAQARSELDRLRAIHREQMEQRDAELLDRRVAAERRRITSSNS